MQKYVVLQVTLKEKLIGTASKNLSELEDVINKQADKGYRLHTISTTSGGSKGLGGGDRIQATMVFERIEQVAFIPICSQATNRDILSSWIRLFLNFLSILCHSRIKIESPG